MTRLHLVRHGAATGEDGDAGLSPLGVAQSRRLADRLRTAGTVEVRHSPRRRAVETAEVLGEVLGTQTAADPRLDDRTPVPAPGQETLYPGIGCALWFGTVPAAERDEGGVRLSAAVEAYLADDRQLVLVTHAFVVAWFVQHVLGAPVSAWTSILATNAGLTTIDRRPRPTATTGRRQRRRAPRRYRPVTRRRRNQRAAPVDLMRAHAPVHQQRLLPWAELAPGRPGLRITPRCG